MLLDNIWPVDTKGVDGWGLRGRISLVDNLRRFL